MRSWWWRSARALALLVFAVACVLIAMHAFTYLYGAFRPRNLFHVQFARSGLDVPAHFFFAGAALLLAPFQVMTWLRRRWPRLHRIGGWLYAAGVLVGGIGGLSMAPHAQGGWASGAAFAVLAPLWIAVTARGIGYAVAGDVARHRQWMWRSVALTSSAVTLRLMLGFGLGLLHAPFPAVYITAAWASWIFNLTLCEWWLRRAAGARRSASVQAAA